MKLHVIIEKDEAGYYVAEVPALPGCLKERLMKKLSTISRKLLKVGLK